MFTFAAIISFLKLGARFKGCLHARQHLTVHYAHSRCAVNVCMNEQLYQIFLCMVLASFDDVGPFDMEPGGRSSQSSLNHVSKANTACYYVQSSRNIAARIV